MFWRRLEDVSARRLEDVLKKSWRHLENALKTFSRCLEDVFAKGLEDVLKTSWRRLEEVWTRRIYWSWARRLEDVLWRRMINKNIFVFIKTSWRRLLKMKTKDVLRSLQDVFIKINFLLGSGVVTHDYTSHSSRAAACCYSISIKLLARYNKNH